MSKVPLGLLHPPRLGRTPPEVEKKEGYIREMNARVLRLNRESTPIVLLRLLCPPRPASGSPEVS